MRVRVPGDKSVTQRALILAALAEGESRLGGLLWGGDAWSTAGALRDLGVQIPELPRDGGDVVIRGVGLRGLSEPEESLSLGNSGTGARLLLGVLAGGGITATIDGDHSLRSRPMVRVTDPLTAMGADFSFELEQGRLPIEVRGRHPLEGVAWSSPVASAQVKSSILLAGLTGGAFAIVTEPRRSRDHSERMLNAVGASVVSHAVGEGWQVELRDPPESIRPLDYRVPGDISSAAFVLAFGALGGAHGPVTVEGVGLNPTRTAFLDVLARMGADVAIEPDADDSIEPTGNVTVGPTDLVGTTIDAEEVPRLIDELPIIAVLGARARGETRITGAEELRAKESDRIEALVSNFRRLGVGVEELADGLVIEGQDAPIRGNAHAYSDHRIAMAFYVLGALDENQVDVPLGMSRVSFPTFQEILHRLSTGRSFV